MNEHARDIKMSETINERLSSPILGSNKYGHHVLLDHAGLDTGGAVCFHHGPLCVRV